MRCVLPILAALALFGCSTPSDAASPKPTPPPVVNGWYAGPWDGYTNYSPGIVLQPYPGGVLQFDIPPYPSQIDALAKNVTVAQG